MAKARDGERPQNGAKGSALHFLSEDEEAMAVAFRRHTLDDYVYALKPSIPHPTRSAFHRCLQRHSISRLPDADGDKPKRQRFKRYPIGFLHMDIAELQTAEGKLYPFVSIDRTSKFAVTQLVNKADRRTAWEFLEHLQEVLPYRIHAIWGDIPVAAYLAGLFPRLPLASHSERGSSDITRYSSEALPFNRRGMVKVARLSG
ncbi:hypothetical protein SAMN04488094_110168 [Tropicimonas isoalkanivorans]|uniref:Transposase n=1 Tax=Tropicimonas isoalkanivorans TaxID=441112 RepID=A0A1I1N225_9RHOB|nr:hypothetical protein SAMN04488094_110168 [Tropicimonas isoalkanivorans]